MTGDDSDDSVTVNAHILLLVPVCLAQLGQSCCLSIEHASLNLFAQVSALDAVPDIDMLIFLPEILDGLFQILGDPNFEIRKM